MRSCIAGVDIGTSSAKTVVVDQDGAVVAKGVAEYPLHSPRAHTAEQNSDEIFTGVMESLRRAVDGAGRSSCRVEGIAFSAAMHSLIALDDRLRPMTPSITWADNRAAAQADRLRRSHDGPDIHRRTGTPLHAMSPLAKLLWFRNEEPELFRAAALWVSIKEFVVLGLTGKTAADHSIASATGLYSLHDSSWDAGVLDLVGLLPEALPDLVPTTHIVGSLLPDVAKQLGLGPKTPVVIGASDGALANVGVGAFHPGMVVCSIGTSGAVRATVDRPTTDERGRLFCYVLGDDLWMVGGPSNNGGSALAWARSALFPDLPDDGNAFAALDRAAAGAPAGAGGLIFLPYLLGERAPQWDSDARAVFFGLTVQHERDHMLRAVLEGVAMQINTILRLVEDTVGVSVEDLRATGGFARMETWRDILAGVLGRPVRFPANHESSAWGAAVLGMLALDRIGSLDWVDDRVTFEETREPDPTDADAYAQMTRLFEPLYDRLRPSFADLARFGGQQTQSKSAE